ncbi:MAG: hypothetical protein CVV42_16805 [Candidatus Riflebacteria bacterium HGW-Riflebacteria-2]|jgi:hypothetical protein|nr:MAG: hypothetical protein CVV42_16805 [Candidatus Riflebacteria bacterium HGW-Riflebacteria-2]
MLSFVIPLIITAVLLIAAVFLYKMLFPPVEDAGQVSIKEVGGNSHVTLKVHQPGDDQSSSHLPAPVFYPETPATRSPRQASFPFIQLILLTSVGYLLYVNQDLIAEKIPADIIRPGDENKPEKQALSLAEVDGHTVVEGINWIKIVATGTDGIPFEGWVSELAIQKEPPKENKAADEFMKKVGMQTNKERLQNIKHIRKVNEALDTALKDFRPKKN